MAKKGNPKWKKGVSGNPKGKPRGIKNSNSFNESIRKAIEKAARKKHKTVGDYLWNMAKDDSRLRAKLIDKVISDAPKNLNIGGEGAQFIVITKGEVKW